MMTSRLLPILLIGLAHAELEYNKSIVATGLGLVETWESLSSFRAASALSYGSITIGEVMTMSFDMTFHGRSNETADGKSTREKVENFFRVGFSAYDGNHCFGSMAHYPSLWIPSDSEVPFMVLTEDNCSATTTELHGLGALVKDNSYRFEMSWNNTHLSVYMENYNVSEDSTTENQTWSQTWTREATHLDYVGESVPVWFISNKFSTQQYNIGDGTFSNIVITSEYATASPTTAQPTHIPTNVPSTVPTVDPTNDPTTSPSPEPTRAPSGEPTPQPTAAVAFRQTSTTNSVVVNKADTESSSISPLTIAIIVIVVLFVVLACHAVFLCGRYRKRKQMKDEHEMEHIVDDEGNVNTSIPVHAPDEVPPQDEPEDTPEMIYEEDLANLEQLSKPDDKQLVC